MASTNENNPNTLINNNSTTDSILKAFLRKNGCQLDDVSVKDDVKSASFVYRGGVFFVQYKVDSTELLLTFPRCLWAETSESTKYLMVCNELTHDLKYVKFIVEYDEEENKIYVSISHETMIVSEDMIESFTGLAFAFQDELKKRLESGAGEFLKNPEATFDLARERYLLREREISHEENIPEDVKSCKVTELGEMIGKIFGGEDMNDMEKLTLIYPFDKIQTLENNEAIYHLDVLEAVYDKEYDSCERELLLVLRTKFNTYTLNLQPKNDNDFTVYISVSAAKIPHDMQDDTMRYVNHRQTPQSLSFLIAYDKSTQTNKRKEYEYMMLDALDKEREGKESELTEEQKWLLKYETDVQSFSADNATNLYWGKKYMLTNRYLEAIGMMQPIYEQMLPDFFSFDSKRKDFFFDICYIIGFSYYNLKQWEKAYYYLDLASAVSNPKYGMPFINLLAQIGDIRTFREIEMLDNHLINAVKQMPDSEPSDEQLNYHLFFLRRNAYTRIFFHDYDAAESILKELLDYDETRAFAEYELNYIKTLRSNEETDDNDTNKIDDTGMDKSF